MRPAFQPKSTARLEVLSRLGVLLGAFLSASVAAPRQGEGGVPQEDGEAGTPPAETETQKRDADAPGDEPPPEKKVTGGDAPDEASRGTPSSAETDAAREFAELVASLRESHPDQDGVQRAADEVQSRLLEFAESYPATPEAARARVLAGEVLRLEGEVKAARALWEDLAQYGPGDDARARGLYLQGEYYFLLQPFLIAPQKSRSLERYRERAERFFTVLETLYPDSAWAAAARRPLGYLRLLKSRRAPAFEGAFRVHGEADEITYRLEELAGKVVLLIFWKASSPGHRAFETDLRGRLAQALQQYPVLQGHVEVLGVSLDRDRERFERAVAEWGIEWPQLFDGRGFETGIARAFHIPRAPHFAVVGPDGTLAYLGADADAFRQTGSSELRALRIELEKQADGEGGGR